MENLKGNIVARNFPEKLVDRKFAEAEKRSRQDLIFQKRKQNNLQNWSGSYLLFLKKLKHQLMEGMIATYARPALNI